MSRKGGGFFVERIRYTTTIALSGEGVKDFLQSKKGITNILLDDGGNFVVGEYSNEKQRVKTQFGKIKIEYWSVPETGNREVVIYSSTMRRKGNKAFQIVAVDAVTGCGRRQLTKGVDIVVSTSAPKEVFSRRKINNKKVAR